MTRAMAGMNRQLSLPALQTILRDFERQNERMDMTSDVMGDAIDDAFEQEGEQEESEELVSQVRPRRGGPSAACLLTPASRWQVLDEIGCTLGAQLLDAPTGSAAAAPPVAARTAVAMPAGDGLDGDLQSRLDALRRS